MGVGVFDNITSGDGPGVTLSVTVGEGVKGDAVGIGLTQPDNAKISAKMLPSSRMMPSPIMIISQRIFIYISSKFYQWFA